MNKSDITTTGEYRKLKPAQELSDIVESIWIQHQCEAPKIRKPSGVLPTGTVELLFHYGDPIAHLENGRLTEMPRSYVTGQRSRSVNVIGTGVHRVIIVSLYPWGLNTLFPAGVDANDGYVDLRLIESGSRVEQLEECLFLAAGTAERLLLVEKFLLETRRGEIDFPMVAASKILAKRGLRKGIHQTTGILEMSERHLSRKFKTVIGLQPSLYMRIMRFQHAMSARRQLRLPWAAIAADCGYSDQPHLIREIRRFAGRAPGQMILDSGAGKSAFNGKGASEFFDTVYV